MSPIANDRPVATTAQPRRADRPAEPEQRSRFEDALSRGQPKEGKQASGERTPADPVVPGHAPHQGFDLMQGGGQRDRGKREQDAAMLDGLRAAPPTSVPLAVEAPAPLGNAVALAATHAEFAARIDLPTQSAGSEFHVSMSDSRWLASHATVSSDNAGGLSLDLAFNGEADGEQQRAALRARLEARGHRVDRIVFGE